MELPFKYIILLIVKMLYNRNMKLFIEKRVLIDFLGEIIQRSFFTTREKKEILNNFNFQYECDDLINKYYKYFDIEGESICFDSDYIEELNDLIRNEIEENNIFIIEEVVNTIDSHTIFLEILGVKIKKELYKILLDIDEELDNSYSELSIYDNCTKDYSIDKTNLVNKIKKLLFKRMILLINTRNLLSYTEYDDFVRYSYDVANQDFNYDNLPFLLDDEYFDETTVLDDIFKKSIFTYNQLCYSTLNSKLSYQLSIESDNIKYSKLKFYLTYLELLEDEIKKENEIYSELVMVKYRLMQVIDTIYDTFVYTNRNILTNIPFEENYDFIEYDVYYFIRELLMYNDEKYRNKNFDIKNMTVYTDNTIKKLYIATYYKLTGDKRIVNSIKNNELYGVNKISTSLLDEIIIPKNKKIKNK